MNVRSQNVHKSLCTIIAFCICFLTSALGEIYASNPDGGTIVALSDTELCIADGVPDLVTVSLSGNEGNHSMWLITNSYDVILDTLQDTVFNLTNFDMGTYHIYHVAYDEFTIEPRIGLAIKKIKGWFGLSNKLIINKVSPNGGFLTTTANQDSIRCDDDQYEDIIDIRLQAERGLYQGWIITDKDNIVRSLPNMGPPFNLNSTGSGTAQIYHYGAFLDDPVINIGQVLPTNNGCFDTSNPITILRESCGPVECLVEAAMISLVDNTQAISICKDDGIPENFTVNATGGSGEQIFVVTTADGTILFTQTSELFSPDNIDEDYCVIWSFAFDESSEGYVAGSNINDITGCHAQGNSITVTKFEDCAPPCNVAAGNIILTNGDQEITVCVDDELLENIDFSKSDQTGLQYSYIITNTNGFIVSIQQEDRFNFEGTGGGQSLVRLISYDVIPNGLIVGQNISILEGCFAISNSIRVNRIVNCAPIPCEVQGGDISIDNSNTVTVCIDDGIADNLSIDLTNHSGPSSTWLTTDVNGNIISFQSDPGYNLEGSSVGTCLFYHLSIDGEIEGLLTGNNIFTQLSGCFDLSNPITVVKESDCAVCDINSGSISSNNQTVFTFCVDDDVSDQIRVDLSGNSGSSTYVVTDEAGTILEINNNNTSNFEGTGEGTCFIRHLSLDGVIQNFGVGQNISMLEGCFELSNAIEIRREVGCAPCEVAAGSINVGGQISLTVCVDDGISDFIDVTLQGNIGSSTYIVTDAQGEILLINNNPIFNFEGAGFGECRIYHVSLSGTVNGLTPGTNIANLEGCFALSNSITVNREINCTPCEKQGGTISVGGEVSVTVCVDDGFSDQIVASLSGNIGEMSTWVVTNMSGMIIMVQTDPNFNFEGSNAGQCQIRHLSLDNTIVGLEIGNMIEDLQGCFAFSNVITVTREVDCDVDPCQVNGGSISSGGLSDFTVCVDDGISDQISVDLQGNVGSSTWVITDGSGNILQVQNNPNFDFEGAGVGECFIWHMSLTGTIDNFGVGQNVSNLNGCYDFSNSIRVIRQIECGPDPCQVDGGSISSEGLTTFTICADDGVSDVISVSLSGNVGSTTWVVTDDSGNILLVQNNSDFEFEGAGGGECFIWHMSLSGEVENFGVGQNVSNLVGCYDLSNSIRVIREVNCGPDPCMVDGGSISSGGLTAFTICADDGVSDVISVSLSGNVGSTTWVVTDDSGNIILVQNNPDFEFEGAGEGECFIWHMSLTGEVENFGVGQNVSNLVGCYDLSNSIRVIRQIDCGPDPCQVDGGSISSDGLNSFTICADDGESDLITVDIEGNVGSSTWVVTDESGTILQVQNNPNFEFEGAGAGVCFIWHMSLTDDISGYGVGLNVSGIDGCFDFSNSISVTRQIDCGPDPCQVDGGSISSDGLTSFTICADDGNSDLITVDLEGNVGSSTWVVTDESGTILQVQNNPNFEFEGAGAGVCFIWHMSLTDDISGYGVGLNVSDIDGCFDFSNSISVTRQIDCGPDPCQVDGGSISSDGLTSFTICADDGNSDLITVDLQGNVGSSTWVVTDESGTILQVQNNPNFEFEGAGAGVCFIWHMSLTNDVSGYGVGLNVSDIDGCFDFSNSISVTRQIDCGPDPCQVDGGSISSDGLTSFTICADDGNSDLIQVDLEGNIGSSTWVVTDELGTILQVQNNPNFEFEGAGAGVCFIWHMSLTNDISGYGVGLNVSDIDGCFDFSNSISVTRQINCGPGPCEALGGTISIEGGSPQTVCVDDGVAESILVSLEGNIGASTWIVTSSDGEILAIQNSPNFSFEGAGPGVCNIYHVGIGDGFSGTAIGGNVSNLSGCFNLSNAIQIVREENCAPPSCTANGGSIALENGELNVTFCVSDGQSDVIDVVLSGTSSSNTYLLTDNDGNIIATSPQPNFNFEGTDAGLCFVYHLSLQDPVTGFSIGANISGLGGCFNLSNPIAINKQTDCGLPECNISGGSILTTTNQAAISICVDDGINEDIEVVVTGQTGANTLVITTQDGEILAIQNSPIFNFEGSPAGICYIYNMSILEPISGYAIGANINDIEGCISLSNPISVTRSVNCGEPVVAVGGAISTSTGVNEISVCADDGVSDIVQAVLSGAQGNSQWVVTNSTGQILLIQNTATFDFEGSGAGVCQIWHLASVGTVTGLQVNANISNLAGEFALSNSVEVTRDINCGFVLCEVLGGTIAGSDAELSYTFCVDDGIDDIVNPTLTGNVGIGYWLVTDQTGTVLIVSDDASFNFESAGPGMCFIWHLSAQDSIFGMAQGMNVDELTGCFSLSNSIEIIREVECGVQPCDIMAGSIISSDTLSNYMICADDGDSDIITGVVTGASGPGIWVVTDQVGTVLALETDPSFDLEGAGQGTCFIRHIVARDSTTNIALGVNINTLEGCVAISDSIQITRLIGCGELTCDDVIAGTISGMEGELEFTACTDDGIPDSLFTVVTGENGGGIWVATDANNVITEITNTGQFNFEGQSPGMSFIRFYSLIDPISGISTGNNIDQITGCVKSSNIITVNRISCTACNVDGGIIVSQDSSSIITLCTDDGIDNAFTAFVNNQEGLTSWLITDTLGNILEVRDTDDSVFNFEGEDEGTCLIWNISTNIAGFILEEGINANDLTGCFDLSNPITIIKQNNCSEFTCDNVVAGSISIGDTVSNIMVCVDDGINEQLMLELEGNFGPGIWMETNEQGVILDLQNEPIFDFEGQEPGLCIIRHLGVLDSLSGLVPGMLFSEAQGCIKESNVVTIMKTICNEVTCDVDGGSLQTSDSLTEISTCVGDGIEEIIDVTVSGNTGEQSSFIITDSTGNILVIQNDSAFEFDNAGLGTCQIYHVSSTETLGINLLGTALMDLPGCFDLSNAITVTRETCEMCNVDGGTIATSEGLTELSICVDDGISDAVDLVVTGSVGNNNIWIVTDTTGLILGLQLENTLDLEGAGEGMCIVYHASLSDTLDGGELGSNINNLDLCIDLSNGIRINRAEDCSELCGVLASEISTTDALIVCTDDGIDDFIDIQVSGGVGDSSIWLITDTLGEILMIPPGPPFNFEGISAGVCLIWQANSSGELTGVSIGADATLIEGCFELSNAISVTRNHDCGSMLCAAEGGSIMTTDSLTSMTICADDGISDGIDVSLTGESGDTTIWVITEMDSTIIALPVGGPPFDFEGQGAGTCLIWALTQVDTISGAQMGANAADIQGCFALSNPIMVIRETNCSVDSCSVVGGSIMTTDSLTSMTICADDGISDGIDVSLTGESGDTTIWVITEMDSTIIALPVGGPPFDFEGQGAGTCLIWALTQEDTISGAQMGANAADIQGCFALSNPIMVIRETNCSVDSCSVVGGTIMTTDSLTAFTICADDDVPDSFDVTLTGGSGDSTIWVITESDSTIIAFDAVGPPFDFEGQGLGTCLVWAFAVEDTLTGTEVGANAADIQGCFALSNPITVTREVNCAVDTCAVVAGAIMFTEEIDTFKVCVDDGIIDSINVEVTGQSAENFVWVVTDADSIIIDLQSSLPITLEGRPAGNCLIWHLGFDGTITGAAVGVSAANISGCFALSNPLMVLKEEDCGGDSCLAEAGEISTIDGLTEVSVCVSDDFEDLVVLAPLDTSVLVGDFGTYLLTDSLGNIVAITGDNEFNFTLDTAGVCFIYHLSDINGVAGISGNIDSLSGCFDLSNPIRVTKELDCMDCPIVGGIISLEDNTQFTAVCAGDGDPDLVNVVINMNTGERRWVVTDTFGQILSLPAMVPIDFEEAGAGVCQIWNMSFSGDLTGVEEGASIDSIGGCFDLSNPITVMRNFVDGGMVSTLEGQTDTTFCVLDGMPDMLRMTTQNQSNQSYIFLLTDDLNRVLATVQDSSDFENTPADELRIWGLSFTGSISDSLIGTFTDVTTLDFEGCYDLSDNFVTMTLLSGDDCTSNFRVDSELSFTTIGNPVRDELILEIESFDLDSEAMIEIRSVDGLMLMDEPVRLEENQMMMKRVDVSHIPNGFYFVTIKSNGIVKSERVIIQR